ncbi:MAG TPA: hypothetical protein VLB67_11085 [Acidimicrobiia bacterium]|nr:hypothetical protein [Acidimicrobiia bacterium]
MTATVAVAIGLAVFLAALWVVRLLATPAPEEPDPDDVREVAVDYRCTVCGLRLTVTHAQDGEATAPRHCREDMAEVKY